MDELDWATRGQLLADGVTDAEVRAAVHRGRLIRLSHGAYAAADQYATLGEDDQYVARIRAMATRSPQLVVSHASAAALYGLPVDRADSRVVHLIRPGDGGHRRSPERWVHTGILPEDQVRTVGPLRVTSPTRTVMDTPRTLSRQRAVAIADAALHNKIVSPRELEQALADSSGARGRPAAARALLRADGRAESPGESRLRLVVAEEFADLELQVEVFDERGRFVGRTDGGLLDRGVLLEFDGFTKYERLRKPGQSVTQIVLEEKRREEALTALGWLVLRFIWADLRHERRIIDRIRAACRRQEPLVARRGLGGTARPYAPIRLAA